MAVDSTQVRQRAALACVPCRHRRVKCETIEGESECQLCRQKGIECITVSVDGRRSSATNRCAKSLKERVDELEYLLEQERQKSNARPRAKASDLPTPLVGSNTQSRRRASSTTTTRNSTTTEMAPPSREPDTSLEIDNIIQHHEAVASSPVRGQEPDRMSPVSSNCSSKGLTDRLLDPLGQLSIDHGTGRLRYFGPLTNLHSFWDVSLSTDIAKRRENNEITTSILRNLSVETHDYLMSCFWIYHNAIFHVVHKEAFYKDKESEKGKNYSGLLHICILAMGYRFADKSRQSVRRLAIATCPRESILHREAKRLFEHELRQPGGIPSIQALLLLADLECGCGRDNTGWMYAGNDHRSIHSAPVLTAFRYGVPAVF
ncbi:hypothetical protein LTS17_010426 [Exophiala oligosperma]